ncbi:serine hydrolase [Cyclobacterium amurskyense]|uniref:serine hydrolase n=1 Tax=Cyclobacterium amurskyense TaxID=320787 RepID=UPI00065E3F3E|nr:serine hydrolase [Cyclobacterium amurskyense]
MLNDYLLTLDGSVELSYIIQDKEGNVLSKLNADKKIPSASIIKIPLLIYFMQNVEEGKVKLSDSYQLKEADKVGGSGKLQYKPTAYPATYEYLAKEMIRVSDNTATNILIRKLGLQQFQEWLRENGYKTTQLNRFMMDFEAIALGQQNYLSAEEMNRLLLGLLNGQLLNKASAYQAIEWLKNCEDDNALPHLLPDGIAVAHKTGTLEYVRGDAGILYGEKTIVLTVMVEHFSNVANADKIIAEIGRLAYQEFAQ